MKRRGKVEEWKRGPIPSFYRIRNLQIHYEKRNSNFSPQLKILKFISNRGNKTLSLLLNIVKGGYYEIHAHFHSVELIDID